MVRDGVAAPGEVETPVQLEAEGVAGVQEVLKGKGHVGRKAGEAAADAKLGVHDRIAVQPSFVGLDRQAENLNFGWTLPAKLSQTVYLSIS